MSKIEEYIKNNCKQCPYCTGFNQCVQFDYDDLEVAVEKCKVNNEPPEVQELIDSSAKFFAELIAKGEE